MSELDTVLSDPIEETVPAVEETKLLCSEDASPSEAPSPAEELSRLREELGVLKATLEQREREKSQAMRELEEFHRLFPDISLQNVPDEVWKQVEEGLPLRAAYALYEKERQLAVYRAEQINRQNAARSAGKAGQPASGEYFSPDEVRSMSQRQVRENYKTILESMKKWNF
ncbi:MAG: hypothetical protein E7668_07255 [Ruminococcaceae bacterium]|nr:hypothetical protein [Oscillospiraceae bacterium]